MKKNCKFNSFNLLHLFHLQFHFVLLVKLFILHLLSLLPFLLQLHIVFFVILFKARREDARQRVQNETEGETEPIIFYLYLRGAFTDFLVKFPNFVFY